MVPFWFLADSDLPLSMTLQQVLGIGAKTQPYSLYGQFGLLNLIDQLNPAVGPRLFLKPGQVIVIPIPLNQQNALPKNWAPAAPQKAGEWVLVECCTSEIHAKLNGIMRRKDLWPQLLAEVNGRFGEKKLKAKPGEWILLPTAVMENKYLPTLAAIPPKPTPKPPPEPLAEVPTQVNEPQEPDLPFYDTEIAPPPNREEDFQAVISKPKRKSSKPRPVKLTSMQQKIKEEPRKANLAAITELPIEAIAEIEKDDPQALDEKLTTESIESLSPEAVEKIPTKTKERKAWKFSFLDAMKPGAQKFFNSMETSAAGVYVGTRVGFSLISPEEKLLSQVQVFGLLAEIRAGWLRGTRLYWDYVPSVAANVNGTQQSIGWNRVLLGYSFEFKLPWRLNAHLAPQLGRYSLRAKLPPAGSSAAAAAATTATEDAEPISAEEFNQANAISGGLYADLEKQAFFYILRVWTSTDRGIAAVSKANEDAVTSRFGVDGFLKGSGFDMFGRNVAPSYLVFASLDSLSLSGKAEDEQNFDLRFFIPYMGAGISLSW